MNIFKFIAERILGIFTNKKIIRLKLPEDAQIMRQLLINGYEIVDK